MSTSYDLIVIGAGPGGYVAVIRSAHLGMRGACIDENAELGGTCLRVGCIPSKALLESSERYYEAKKGALSVHGIGVGEVTLDLAALLARKDKVVGQLTAGVAFLFKKNGITPYRGRGRLLFGPARLRRRPRSTAIASAPPPRRSRTPRCPSN